MSIKPVLSIMKSIHFYDEYFIDQRKCLKKTTDRWQIFISVDDKMSKYDFDQGIRMNLNHPIQQGLNIVYILLTCLYFLESIKLNTHHPVISNKSLSFVVWSHQLNKKEGNEILLPFIRFIFVSISTKNSSWNNNSSWLIFNIL